MSLVLLDDVGFGHASTFGGPVQTPVLQRLADEGLRYNRFHTTAMRSPSRAALLTGRNHHSAHTGTVMELSTGFPGYDSMIGKDTATVAETLRLRGYSTAAFGKWHNTPDWETSSAGPFDRWPTGLDFEYFYGFQDGEASQWRTPLYEAPPRSSHRMIRRGIFAGDRGPVHLLDRRTARHSSRGQRAERRRVTGTLNNMKSIRAITPVSDLCRSPATFTGTIKRVLIDITGVAFSDLATRARIALALQ